MMLILTSKSLTVKIYPSATSFDIFFTAKNISQFFRVDMFLSKETNIYDKKYTFLKIP